MKLTVEPIRRVSFTRERKQRRLAALEDVLNRIPTWTPFVAGDLGIHLHERNATIEPASLQVLMNELVDAGVLETVTVHPLVPSWRFPHVNGHQPELKPVPQEEDALMSKLNRMERMLLALCQNLGMNTDEVSRG